MSLVETARTMVSKGILAADESARTIERNFGNAGVPSSPENQRAWRELLFAAPGIERFISGVILFDETTRQSTSAGVRFVDLLARKGIVPGVKVDRGVVPLANSAPDTVTEGIDGLGKRLAEYAAAGLRFAKWRGVYRVGASARAIRANGHALARYAALCQEAGIVPIVEPEVLMDGEHHIADAGETTEAALHELFSQLHFYGVDLEGTVLKPNMVTYGYPKKPTPTEVAEVTSHCEEVAAATLATLRRCVPAAIAGIAFLSGGQPDEAAVEHLRLMNLAPQPWRLSYSYGRGLQMQALAAWGGDPNRAAGAQETFLAQAEAVFNASHGR